MPRFNPKCELCPRLAKHLWQVRAKHPSYHARPVAPFGDSKAHLLIVGLAPGMHDAVLRAFDLKRANHAFAHGALHRLPHGMQLLDSYHCSRYNTQTRRLTHQMFDSVLKKAKALLAG